VRRGVWEIEVPWKGGFFSADWIHLHYLLTAVENGGAGRSKMVALGGVDFP
jgi:hypothetical protein